MSQPHRIVPKGFYEPGVDGPITGLGLADPEDTKASEEVLPLHPIAQLFPPMGDEEWEAAKPTIRKDLQRSNEIRTWKGQVVEGRHRYRLALEEGRPYRFREMPVSAEW
ncbi:MAG: hypothetical protein RBU21_02800, partial [FCB group bacterium]|nr:hypothetical protein [FCB group bacterium]